MSNIELRFAVEVDLPQINDIYNHYVSTSTCVWTTHLCTEQERNEFVGPGRSCITCILIQ
jgi:L-amino acid N-acyltransferase YncA